MENKIEYGLSNAHVAKYKEENGTITIGTPVSVPGVKALQIQVSENETKVYADNIVYFALRSIDGRTATLTNCLFSDEFKLNFLNFKKDNKGGIVRVDNMLSSPICLIFEGEGDKHKRRHMLINCVPGSLEKSFKTKEQNIEVDTEDLALSVLGLKVGDDQLAYVSYKPGDAGYDALLTAPTIPDFTATPTQ